VAHLYAFSDLQREKEVPNENCHKLVETEMRAAFPKSSVSVPTGNRVDVGGSWHVVRGLRVGAWERNLQSAEHVESNGTSVATGLVRQSIAVKLSWDFNPVKKQ
jgi:hypothetical protein